MPGIFIIYIIEMKQRALFQFKWYNSLPSVALLSRLSMLLYSLICTLSVLLYSLICTLSLLLYSLPTPASWTVRLGEHDLTVTESTEQDVAIQAIIIHNLYDTVTQVC